MKKIYNTPKLKVVMLNGADIIATSGELRMSSASYFGGNDSSEEGGGAGD